MALSTFSKFYYLNESVDSTNLYINFDEGSGELSSEVNVGSYTPTNLMVQVKTAMDVIGTQEYTVTFDRVTRKVTISATSNFDLLISSGTQASTSIWDLIGFTQTTDLTGTNSYTGQGECGEVYFPQFYLQDYTDPEDFQEKIEPSINESANGVIETVSFGDRRKVEMSILYVTDRPQDGKIIKNNPNGKADAQQFMQFLITRSNLEFMPDEGNEADYLTIQLEKTPESGKGVGYKLKEEVGKNLPGYYKTGKLTFRTKDD